MGSIALQTLVLLLSFFVCDGDKKLVINEPGADEQWKWDSTHGWHISSWPEAYTACDIQTSIVDTIRSPFIKLSNSVQVKIVNVEIEFVLRSCSSWPKKVAKCSETIGLYLIEQNQELPKPKFENFTRLVANLKPTPKETVTNVPIEAYNTSKVLIPVTVTKGGLYLALRQVNACSAIFSFKVWYSWCPFHKKGLVMFPGVWSPAVGSVSVPGMCFDNAVSKAGLKTVSAFCDSQGNWKFNLSSTCFCQAGYQLTAARSKCQGCPSGTYKSQLGNHKCTRCPAYSFPEPARTGCSCIAGYYRAAFESNSFSCTTIPSSPRNISVSFTTEDTLKVTWEAPLHTGGRNDVFYNVHCLRLNKNSFGWENCDKIHYYPKSTGLGNKTVILTNLKANSLYQLRIEAMNGISGVANESVNFAEVNVTTKNKTRNKSLSCHICTNLSGACDTTKTMVCHKEANAGCYHGYVTFKGSNGATTTHQVMGCTRYAKANFSQQCVALENSAQRKFTKCQITWCSGDLCNYDNVPVSTTTPTDSYKTSELPSTKEQNKASELPTTKEQNKTSELPTSKEQNKTSELPTTKEQTNNNTLTASAVSVQLINNFCIMILLVVSTMITF